MKLEYVLSHENINGEIYRCDVKRYFGWDLPRKKINELHGVLTRIKDENNRYSQMEGGDRVSD